VCIEAVKQTVTEKCIGGLWICSFFLCVTSVFLPVYLPFFLSPCTDHQSVRERRKNEKTTLPLLVCNRLYSYTGSESAGQTAQELILMRTSLSRKRRVATGWTERRKEDLRRKAKKRKQKGKPVCLLNNHVGCESVSCTFVNCVF